MSDFDSPPTTALASSAVPSRPLRVLHVSATLNRGGVETWLTQVLLRLPRAQYECDVCTYRFEAGAYTSTLRDYGCGIYFVPLRFTPTGLLRFGRGLTRLLREGDYDVVHSHGLAFIGYVLLIAWLANVPARIGHSHSTDRLTSGRLASILRGSWLSLNRVLARAFSTRGVGCSEEAQEALFGRGWRGRSKYSIVHCGIDLTRFEPAADRRSMREMLGIAPESRVIGHVSNLGMAKNPQFLLEIAEYVFRQRSDVVLLIVGGGIPLGGLEQMCEELGIRSRVIFTGVRSDVPDLMLGAMDIFVMPSLHEGLPLVLLEAQAAGLPCLVSDVVSREARAGESTVQFIPLSDGAAGWGDRILSQLEGSFGHESVLQALKNCDFNIVVSARRVAELYDDAAHNRQPGGEPH